MRILKVLATLTLASCAGNSRAYGTPGATSVQQWWYLSELLFVPLMGLIIAFLLDWFLATRSVLRLSGIRIALALTATLIISVAVVALLRQLPVVNGAIYQRHAALNWALFLSLCVLLVIRYFQRTPQIRRMSPTLKVGVTVTALSLAVLIPSLFAVKRSEQETVVLSRSIPVRFGSGAAFNFIVYGPLYLHPNESGAISIGVFPKPNQEHGVRDIRLPNGFLTARLVTSGVDANQLHGDPEASDVVAEVADNMRNDYIGDSITDLAKDTDSDELPDGEVWSWVVSPKEPGTQTFGVSVVFEAKRVNAAKERFVNYAFLVEHLRKPMVISQNSDAKAELFPDLIQYQVTAPWFTFEHLSAAVGGIGTVLGSVIALLGFFRKSAAEAK